MASTLSHETPSLLGLLPKVAFIAASVPQCVLGGLES